MMGEGCGHDGRGMWSQRERGVVTKGEGWAAQAKYTLPINTRRLKRNSFIPQNICSETLRDSSLHPSTPPLPLCPSSPPLPLCPSTPPTLHPSNPPPLQLSIPRDCTATKTCTLNLNLCTGFLTSLHTHVCYTYMYSICITCVY